MVDNLKKWLNGWLPEGARKWWNRVNEGFMKSELPNKSVSDNIEAAWAMSNVSVVITAFLVVLVSFFERSWVDGVAMILLDISALALTLTALMMPEPSDKKAEATMKESWRGLVKFNALIVLANILVFAFNARIWLWILATIAVVAVDRFVITKKGWPKKSKPEPAPEAPPKPKPEATTEPPADTKSVAKEPPSVSASAEPAKKAESAKKPAAAKRQPRTPLAAKKPVAKPEPKKPVADKPKAEPSSTNKPVAKKPGSNPGAKPGPKCQPKAGSEPAK